MQTATEPQKEKFGLPGSTIDAICGIFADYPVIQRVMLYGSRAKGSNRPGSDIDLAIVGPVTEEVRLQIETRLDDLLLPYTIDLSLFPSIRNPSLLDHIERVGLTFYPRN